MNKKITKKDNVIDFPNKLSSIEKEIEAIVFAAAEPLDIETIENKISKKTNVEKILLKLQNEYSNRGINLVCISKKWSFRTSPNLSEIMKQEMTKSAEMMGLPKGVDMSIIFNQMSEMIELMRKQFDIGTF